MDVSLVPNDDGDLVFSNGGHGDLLRAHAYNPFDTGSRLLFFSGNNRIGTTDAHDRGEPRVKYRPVSAFGRVGAHVYVASTALDGARWGNAGF